MGSKRRSSRDESDKFVAYDPKEKTCTAADRALIKRHAGKQGSETKKRRLRQERASKSIPLSQDSTDHNDSGTTSASTPQSRQPSQRIMAQAWSDTPRATQSRDDRNHLLPQTESDTFWAGVGAPNWQTTTCHSSGPTSRSWNDADTTPFASFDDSSSLTPSGSCGPGVQCHFSLQSEFREPNFLDHDRQCRQAGPTQQYVPRTFGSFDSGFQDSDTFGYDLTYLSDSCDLPPAGHNHDHAGRIQNVSDALPPSARSTQMETSVLATHANPSPLVHGEADPFESDTPSDNGKQSIYGSRLGQLHFTTSQTRSSIRMERRPSWQYSPKASDQSLWPNIDGVLVRWIKYKEQQGQLSPGSAPACLSILSKCEEVRSLWSVNLSRVNPTLVLCAESPNNVYARAKSRLQSMPPGKRMDVEGTLIKLGIVEYIAISLAFEVASLEEDVATRKGLGIWTPAEAIVDYRLARLVPGVRSMSDHLWPDDEELTSLRGP